MNEKIQELLIQAFFDESTSVPSDKMHHLGDNKMQLFAELIVRECADIADFCEQVKSTETVSSVLKRHFELDK